MTTTRQQMLGGLADRILALRLDHPTRVGIDGHSAAGKTTLADELATSLRGKTARPVLCVTLDRFKRHAEMRTQYPAGSRKSYYFGDVRRRRHPRRAAGAAGSEWQPP